VTFAVVGAGSIGTFLAASLAEAGYEVTVVARGTRLTALREFPVEVEGTRRSFSVRVRATSEPADAGPVDVVFLTVKAHDLAAAADALGPLLGERTIVVPLQNGIPWWYFTAAPGPLHGTRLESVDPGGAIERVIDVRRVVACVVYSGALLRPPAGVRQSGDLDYVFGEPGGGTSPRVANLVAALREAGIDALETDDVRAVIWTKLLGNSTFNPISALTRATAAQMVGDGLVQGLVREAMTEQIALGERIGLRLDVSIDARIARTAILGEQRTSMLQDVEANRPLETEALLGAVVEIADRAGAAIGVTRHLYGLVRLLDRSLRPRPLAQVVRA